LLYGDQPPITERVQTLRRRAQRETIRFLAFRLGGVAVVAAGLFFDVRGVLPLSTMILEYLGVLGPMVLFLADAALIGRVHYRRARLRLLMEVVEMTSEEDAADVDQLTEPGWK
jgi:hypothetical protein